MEWIWERLSQLDEAKARELLGDKGYTVLAMYAGFFNGRAYLLTEIAALFGVLREEVKAWLEEAKAKLAAYSS